MIIGMERDHDTRMKAVKKLERRIAGYFSNERLWARLEACYYEALERVPTQQGSAHLAGVSEMEWIESHLCPPAPADTDNEKES